MLSYIIALPEVWREEHWPAKVVSKHGQKPIRSSSLSMIPDLQVTILEGWEAGQNMVKTTRYPLETQVGISHYNAMHLCHQIDRQ